MLDLRVQIREDSGQHEQRVNAAVPTSTEGLAPMNVLPARQNTTPSRSTIRGTKNPSVTKSATTRNNGRYNGNGREWATPSEIFDPLHREFGFTLDVCATPANAKCPYYFTEAQNGLDQIWAGERVWMNPPYGKEIYAWTRKARAEAYRAQIIVALLPASTDLAWWHEDVMGEAGASEIRYIRGRVRFLTDGPYRASGFFPSVVVVWR